MSCACGWDKLCSGGRAATVEILDLLQSCIDWTGVREPGT